MKIGQDTSTHVLKKSTISPVLYFGIFIFFQIVVISIFTPVFETNDDAIMMLIASGFFTGQPSDALIFINFILGKLLVGFYIALPAYNWYIIFHFLVLILAISGICTLLKLKFSNSLLSTGFLMVCIPALILPQYTTTAFLVGGLGWIIFWELQPSINGRYILLISICLILSYWIRYHVFIFLAVLNLPISIYKFFTIQQKTGIILVLASILFFLCHQKINKTYYLHTYHHEKIYKYQQAIDAFANHPVIFPDNFHSKVSLPNSSIQLLDDWFWIDTETFNIEKIEEVAQIVKYKWSIPKVIYRTYLSVWKEKWFLIALLFFFLPFLKVIYQDKNFRFLLLSTALITVILIIYFAGFHKLPHRLFYSLLLFQFLLLIIIYENPNSLTRNKKFYILLPTFVVILFLSIRISLSNQKTKANALTAIEYFSKHPDQLFIIRSHGLQYEGVFTLANPALFSKQNIIPTNWVINTPLFEQIYKKHKIYNLIDEISNSNTIIINLDTNSINSYLCEKRDTVHVFNTLEETLPQATGEVLLWETVGTKRCKQ